MRRRHLTRSVLSCLALTAIAVSAVWTAWCGTNSNLISAQEAATKEADGPAQPPADAKPLTAEEKAAALEAEVTQGALRIVAPDGNVVECPLKHTDVAADISGFIARVNVTQTFHNPAKEKIEAVYVFPLPHEAAIDQMTMVLGDRKIVGRIKRREEARAIYEQALLQGETAALLEQERPNIFTQSVGNIEPGQDVKIEISFVDVLRYDMGVYEFQFPMVVGPRYNPGYATDRGAAVPQELQGKVSPPAPNTTRVPDASRISPPVLKAEFRNGHDISLAVSLDAGVPIQDLKIASHQAKVEREGDRRATIKLSKEDSLPNKDFVLRYGVAGKKPEMALLAHTGNYSADARGLGNGYFLLMIQPQEDERLTKSPPREIVFLVDVSGSMSGQPTAKVIEAMRNMLKLCRQGDTVQVITFAGQAASLFEKPVPATAENIQRAVNFTDGIQAGGGTEMLKGVKLAIDAPIDPERLRIVMMLTDGYIGNEAEIIEHVGQHCGDQIRFWCIGIGASPNMFLVDGVAKQGGGMGKTLGLEDDSTALTQEVMTRIQRAQLAKIKIDWGGLQVSETYPAKIPELWAGRPVVVVGRYSGGGQPAAINVQGSVEGQAVSWPLSVSLPADEPAHDVLARVWARRKIEDLMQQTYYFGSPAVEEAVTAIALDYRLMSQYTSFVAVDEREADKALPSARPPRRMLVPVPLPEGTRWEGFFGERTEDQPLALDRFQLREESKSVRALSRLSVVTEQLAKKMPAADGALGGRAYARSRDGLARRKSLRGGAMPASGSGHRFSGGGGGGFGYALGIPATASQPAEGLPQGRTNLALSFDKRVDLKDMEKREGELLNDYASVALATEAAEMVPLAQAALVAGKAHQIEGRLAEARTALLQAWFLDSAAANVGASQGETAEAALSAIEEVHRLQVADWTKKLPTLGKRLDLVIRDKPLAEAIAAVAKAAGVKVTLSPDSVDDAKQLLNETELRVSFLDLRGATLAQALDWLLIPARLNWRLEKKSLVAEADRRTNATTAWLYDVSSLALPTEQETGKEQEYEQAVAAARQAAEGFLKGVQAGLQPGEGESVAWFAPGELLVVGQGKTHAAAARLIADLADPDAKLEGETGALHAVTAARAKERQGLADKAQAAKRRFETAQRHGDFGWQLLGTAADGRLDLEALTELQIAWHSAATDELLAGPQAALVMRSLWTLAEAARALPNETELTALAQTAAEKCRAAAERLRADLEKNPEDAALFIGTLYAALALRDDGEFAGKAATQLTAAGVENSPLAGFRLVARALLAEREAIDGPALAGLLSGGYEGGLAGDDLVLLTAVACRRAGGDSWQSFRAASRDLLGRQPLDGDVVVLINRLAHPALPLAAANAE